MRKVGIFKLLHLTTLTFGFTTTESLRNLPESSLVECKSKNVKLEASLKSLTFFMSETATGGVL